MNQGRFDELAKALATNSLSRRKLLKAFFVGLIALMLGQKIGSSKRAAAAGVRVVAAGDIASCHWPVGAQATARLVERIAPDAVLTLGDTAYEDGTYEEFRDCYDPSWGRFKEITYPVLGNHDYGQGGFEDRDPALYDASGFHSYFDVPERGFDIPEGGYYSYDLGDWHLVALNSNYFVIGCEEGSEQYRWLEEDLRRTDRGCILAYWHHPVYSHGYYEEPYAMQQMLELLYTYGVDVVLNGHDHAYDRRAPVDPRSSEFDPEGVRQFVVGTGGNYLCEFGADEHTEVRSTEDLGVLRLTLLPGEYEWEFVTVEGKFKDRGKAFCHKKRKPG